MPKSPPPRRLSIPTNLLGPDKFLKRCQVQELARASCGCGSTAAAWSLLPVPLSRLSFASLVLASSGARLAGSLGSTTMPTSSVLVGTGTLTLDLTCTAFLAALAVPFPFLASLATPLAAFAKAVHNRWSRGVLSSNLLECELTSAGFVVGLNFDSNLLLRDQSCTAHGKILFQLAWVESFRRSCLDVFIKSCCRRSACVASYRRTSSSPLSRVPQESLVVCTDLETVFVARALCDFFHSDNPNGGPNVSAPRDLMELLQGRSILSESVKAKSATWACLLFSRMSSPCSQHQRV